MYVKKSKGEIVFDIFNVIGMVILMFITIYPLWYVLVASFSDGLQFMGHLGPLFLPKGFSLSAYNVVIHNPMILRGYLNTFFVVVAGVILNLLMTSLGAYFLSRKGVVGRDFIMMAIVFTMFFSGGLIPFYFTIKGLHLDNTLWALIIPGAISTFNLIILKTAFAAIPDSLEESAKLDGASHFTILFRIIIPLAAPTIAVMVLFYGVGHWNAWFNAMLFLRKRELYPLQLVLREILIQNTTADAQSSMTDSEGVGETIKYAVIVVATVPILAVYPFLQKYFVKGVMVGAVKG